VKYKCLKSRAHRFLTYVEYNKLDFTSHRENVDLLNSSNTCHQYAQAVKEKK
jgi:hypothetical protein